MPCMHRVPAIVQNVDEQQAQTDQYCERTVFEFLKTFKGYFKLKGIGKVARIVQDSLSKKACEAIRIVSMRERGRRVVETRQMTRISPLSYHRITIIIARCVCSINIAYVPY
jgi:hypothetical protein